MALRGFVRRPTLWVELTVAAAWAALLLGERLARGEGGPAGDGGWASGPLWICTTGMGGGGGGAGRHLIQTGGVDSASLLTMAPMWGVMALAMMVPGALPAVRHVAHTSLYWRRRRATVEFLAVFVGLWTAFGLLVLAQLDSWGPAGSPLFAAALAAAALWQLTPLKRRALLACHRSHRLPPRGWRATGGVANFALRNGAACLGSCWAMMAAASLAGPGRFWWMGAMTAAMAAEKLVERPRWASRRVAALLAAAAAGVALAAVL